MKRRHILGVASAYVNFQAMTRPQGTGVPLGYIFSIRWGFRSGLYNESWDETLLNGVGPLKKTIDRARSTRTLLPCDCEPEHHFPPVRLGNALAAFNPTLDGAKRYCGCGEILCLVVR